MGQLSLPRKPDVHYFVDHFIDVIPQSTAARRRASAIRSDGARDGVCQESPAQTIHRRPVHAKELPSDNRLFSREGSSPQWSKHRCHLLNAAAPLIRIRHRRSSSTFVERISRIKGHSERASKITDILPLIRC